MSDEPVVEETVEAPPPEVAESQYASGPGEVGKPVGPEHDKSFHVENYYDPATGERVATEWDTPHQEQDPGIGTPPGTGEPPPPDHLPPEESGEGGGVVAAEAAQAEADALPADSGSTS